MRARLLKWWMQFAVWRLGRGWFSPVEANPLRPHNSLVARLEALRRRV